MHFALTAKELSYNPQHQKMVINVYQPLSSQLMNQSRVNWVFLRFGSSHVRLIAAENKVRLT